MRGPDGPQGQPGTRVSIRHYNVRDTSVFTSMSFPSSSVLVRRKFMLELKTKRENNPEYLIRIKKEWTKSVTVKKRPEQTQR